MAVETTTGTIADALGADLIGRADLPIDAVAPIERAGPRSLTFIRTDEYARLWPGSAAAAAIVSRALRVPGHNPEARTLLLVDDADIALIRTLELFAARAAPPPPPPGVHPSAVVDPAAAVAASATVGPGCVVEAGASVGEGSVLVARVFVGRGASIGKRCTLHPGVTVYHNCRICDHCIIHAGTVIGADGFGYRPAPDGSGLVKIPHLGAVLVEPAVEIGANSTIDRGKLDDTVIGAGTKIDNLVQVGHSCRVGRCCVLCGQVGLAGSVVVEDGAMLGGQVGVGDNLRVGARAKVGAQSGVMDNVPAGESWFATPALNAHEAMRNIALLRRLAGRLDEIKARIKALESEHTDRP
ncbi:MAG: UDP-3-O-(3-hydroxymyristoyl)glucosamine N-acyltransferase [Leptolyngbya sp. PLA2]|nr:UDP-3-O-(3-hydroxymyristoyl)glucosamine N-acyltransferase [Leptolyngbya sp.]MCE7971071.1 UDP-3-O-(3-hydroxymyristoyl)glucosamine N-acyltransferase [Leptolyngbya sp. PL-A2]MCZ7631856.1 UDP-3-O-(3-hydroxymyristoyl)glucosamine N-acyltransferase [Phycisphaerales bacterium]MDL1905380.1 UDP-3-O-(3-hydroxymyristoyl)glucosamine N-acyltransferase [Synechococcales cyanobacterium CNB]GIK20339.1 MAG: UDP-3-O-acylglucosamine N-acyltransferase [Planctomycetota bacterium]